MYADAKVVVMIALQTDVGLVCFSSILLLHNIHGCRLHPDHVRHQQYTQLLDDAVAAAAVSLSSCQQC